MSLVTVKHIMGY